MNGAFLDDLARQLAESMPRSRVLRLAAAAAVTAVVPSAFTRAALAEPLQFCRGDCPSHRRTPWPFCRCCPEGTSVCEDKCCPRGSNCGRGTNGTRCCPPRNVPCGRLRVSARRFDLTGCCPTTMRCNYRTGRCGPRCPRGSISCGLICCGPGEQCSRGRCVERCQPRSRKCGRKCCQRGTFCCDEKRQKLCCAQGTDCCNTAPPGAPERWSCCSHGERCARMILPGQGGVTPASPRVCCPPERVVPLSAVVCCPPGYRSLGGDVVLPPGGGGGLCCREDKFCPGQDRCCSTGSATAPELETHCCGGRCINLRSSSEHCGACGRACAPGQTCRDSQCVAA